MDPHIRDVYITIREVRQIVHLSANHIYRMVSEGKFPPYVKVGRRSLWSSNDLRIWLETMKAEAYSGGRLYHFEGDWTKRHFIAS